MEVTFVDRPEQLAEMAAALSEASRVALDIEWRPDGLYDDPDSSTRSPASTLQLAVDKQCGAGAAQVYIVDLLAIDVCFFPGYLNVLLLVQGGQLLTQQC
jgi:hypothetical protein